jgi:hypothetical protein
VVERFEKVPLKSPRKRSSPESMGDVTGFLEDSFFGEMGRNWSDFVGISQERPVKKGVKK